MLEEATDVQATVLKVAHHGSRTSTSADFLAAARPVYGIISAGKDNSFGHPHADIVTRLQQQDVKILRTDHDGAIVFVTDGRHLRVSTFAEQSLTDRLQEAAVAPQKQTAPS